MSALPAMLHAHNTTAASEVDGYIWAGKLSVALGSGWRSTIRHCSRPLSLSLSLSLSLFLLSQVQLGTWRLLQDGNACSPTILPREKTERPSPGRAL